MSATENCKAAGDFGKVENIVPTDAIAPGKSIENGVAPKAAENGNGQSFEKLVQEESCLLPGKETNDEQLAKGDSELTKAPETKNDSGPVEKLELEIQKRTHERDNYHRKMVETENKLAALQASYNAVTTGKGDEMAIRRELEDLKNLLTQSQLKLDDRGRIVANQENQINALTSQVSSLKEVVAITKDLLNIRNMEVKHLQDNVDSMEVRIIAEREKHNMMLNKMDSAARLNADLKKEYETQLRLFQDLRGKYEEKVTLLSEENRALGAKTSTE
ncbi:uncharacterized protein C458.02c isoform X1 [Belonocnema kinseyi]|uniref:uncharacterized protein C458.02c isoform X1 n=1 Tax=Belonocnema kinseyi TaxID=2817044 RepID=UPI00143E06E4|nr:uncharacterized protein C458.02c isoform X1 [Belonocnema kinseyi]